MKKFKYLYHLQEYLKKKYSFLGANIPRQYSSLGDDWAEKFNRELEKTLGGYELIEKAADGYAEFAMDSLILTAKFQKTREYDFKTYEEAANEVYQSFEYMNSLYLPGILLSHYLWEHHYAQYEFYKNKIVPHLPQEGFFYDVGVGTGFYSRNILRDSNLKGIGIDMSPHSLAYTRKTIENFGFSKRYSSLQCNFYEIQSQLKNADFICSIEVLEHLEDPQIMINHLYQALKPGGYGMISAAVNAPNADHIYLYRSGEEVAKQITNSGFSIIEETCDKAYQARRKNEIVPENYGALIKKV